MPSLRAEFPTITPRLRGRLHQIMFWLSIPAGVVVIAAARDALTTTGATLYAVSLAALFGASAAYHRGRWTPAVKVRMQRLDRAMIFVLIAGSYTPIVLVALRPAWGITLLIAAWSLAAVGVAVTLVHWDFMSRNGGIFYVVFGWLLAVALPVIIRELTGTQLLLLVAGGVVYTIGAIGFGLRRPQLSPKVFGYHEAWHVMTVVAAACHYALVVSLVR
jgi:hemolysin III